MKRYQVVEQKDVEDERADKFINELIEICKKHGFSLTHEDCFCNFIIDKLTDDNTKSLNDACIGYKC